MTTRLRRSTTASLPLHPYTTRGSTAQGPSTTFTLTNRGFLLSLVSIIKGHQYIMQSDRRKLTNLCSA